MFKRKNIQIPPYISNPKTKTPEEYMTCFSSLFLDHAFNDIKNRKNDPSFYGDATKVVADVLKEKYKKSRNEIEKIIKNVKQEIFNTESEKERKKSEERYETRKAYV